MNNSQAIEKQAVTRCCPRCGQPPLESTSFQGQTVDLCPRCGGLWCEVTDWQHAQLGPIPQFGLDQTRAGEERAPAIVYMAQSSLPCPHCERPLVQLQVGEPALCTIEQCDHCGGIWFDHNEWEHLEALRQWPAELEKLEAVPTRWNWWVQFILRLPTEFNIRPRRFPTVTVSLIGLCVIVFLGQLAAGRDHWLFLATRPSTLAAGRGYTSLLTSIFLHGSLLHLAGNMYYLYVVGDNVEDALGPRDYLLFYLACGVIASLVFVIMDWGSNIPALGASGAIAGVMAAYLLLFRRARLTMMLLFWQVKVAAWIWLGSWLALNFLNALLTMNTASQTGGTGWWAHIGGFLAGLALIWPLEQRIVRRYPLLHVMRTQGAVERWFQWS